MSQEQDDEFTEAIDGWLNAGNLSERLERLAEEFGVSSSDVSRWVRGTSRPHPSKQRQVIRYVRENP